MKKKIAIITLFLITLLSTKSRAVIISTKAPQAFLIEYTSKFFEEEENSIIIESQNGPLQFFIINSSGEVPTPQSIVINPKKHPNPNFSNKNIIRIALISSQKADSFKPTLLFAPIVLFAQSLSKSCEINVTHISKIRIEAVDNYFVILNDEDPTSIIDKTELRKYAHTFTQKLPTPPNVLDIIVIKHTKV